MTRPVPKQVEHCLPSSVFQPSGGFGLHPKFNHFPKIGAQGEESNTRVFAVSCFSLHAGYLEVLIHGHCNLFVPDERPVTATAGTYW